MAGDKHHALRVLAVRQGHTQRGHSGQARGDAVHHLHLYACGLQMRQLFAATPKNEGVAALQPHDVFALMGGHHHEFFNKGLRRRFAAAALADVDNARAGGGMGGNDFVVDQVVHQQHRGGLNCFNSLDGQQLGVARAGPNQSAFAFENGRLVRYLLWVFHSCPDRCKICSTCRAIGGGTALSPAITRWM